MKTARQVLLFVVVGGVQVAVDVLVFAAIFIVADAPVVGNVVSRATAAVIGFTLNRRYTFDAWRIGEAGGQGLRYIALWLALTALSTLLVAMANAALEGVAHGREWMLVLKLLIEATLALLSFLGMRYAVFRRQEQ